ncbi:MAG TPA: carboxypeptidase-like regulatory domain-containing protein [Gemmatimonadaceae bacterium]|nr:carboxypeptidase-like regulatory domain-containing protein [Gemmatimonadaceae bacterium]
MHHLDEGTIHAWLDGALSAEESRAVEAHVTGCAECAALVVEARGLVAGASRILLGLDDIPAGVIPAGRATPVTARRSRQRRWWTGGPALRAAAAMLVIASAGALISRSGVPDFLSGEAMRAPAADVAEMDSADMDAADATAPVPSLDVSAEARTETDIVEITQSVEASGAPSASSRGATMQAPAAPPTPSPVEGAGTRGVAGAGVGSVAETEAAAKVSGYASGAEPALPPPAPQRTLADISVPFVVGRAAIRDSMATVRGQQSNIAAPAPAMGVESRGGLRAEADAQMERARPAEIVIEGQVTNAETGAGIGGIQAYVQSAASSAVTDSSGRFRLTLPDTLRGSSVLVSARGIGYAARAEEITLHGGTARVDFALSSSAVALQSLVVTGTAERRARAADVMSERAAPAAPAEPGRFLSGAELEGCWAVSLGGWRPSRARDAGALPTHLWLAPTLLDMTAEGPLNELRRGADLPGVPGSHWRIGAPDSVHLTWRESTPAISLRLIHRPGGLRSTELRGIAVQGELTADVVLRRVDAARCE